MCRVFVEKRTTLALLSLEIKNPMPAIAGGFLLTSPPVSLSPKGAK